MKYEDLSEGIRTAVHDEWNDFSYELAVNSEDGRFSMMDVRKAFYAGIGSTLKQLGWHPASEPPKLGEDDDNEFIVIASVDNELYRHGPMIDKPKKAMFIDGQWTEPNVKWWIAPPEKEK